MKKVFAVCFWAVLHAGTAFGQDVVTIAWDPSPDVRGYRLFAGTAPSTYTSSQDVGNVTDRAIALPAGTHYFAVRSYDVWGTESELSTELVVTVAARSTPALPEPPPPPALEDADLPMDEAMDRWEMIWQHSESGRLAAWTMNSLAMSGGGSFGPGSLPRNWFIRASADFDADGRKDVVVQNAVTGELSAWLMDGSRLLEVRSIARLTDPKWQVVGAGDFNADNKPDLVFQHPALGVSSVWLMDGTAYASGRGITPGPLADLDWRIVAVSDMNSDSKPDLVWQHRTTGRITSWLMDGVAMRGAGTFSSAGPTDPHWRLHGVADIDGSGGPDLIWHHAKTGHVAAWMLSGREVVDARLLTPSQVNPGWIPGTTR